jgi:hypothetical protein
MVFEHLGIRHAGKEYDDQQDFDHLNGARDVYVQGSA